MTAPNNPRKHRLAGEQGTLAVAVRSLVRRAPIVCAERETVRRAVEIMHTEKIGAIVVVDDGQQPVGVFTERDLIGVALQDGLEQPLVAVMTRDPVTVPGHMPAYEVAVLMTEHRFRHALITEAGTLVGVVSERDLFALQRLGLSELTLEIRLARDVEAVARLADRVRQLIRLLVGQGVAAEHLTQYMSVLNDLVCQRIIDLVRKGYHWDRISWCWLAFGSEGRLEQTFATDQDNGLIFEAHAGAGVGSTRGQLLPFARAVNEALDECGYPLCPGGVMASNPEFCLSTSEWRAKLGGWVDESDPQALLRAAICLDFRALHGDARLATDLRDGFLGVARKRQTFLRLLAEQALQARPPLGRWRDFTTEDVPDAPGTMDLKRYGLSPFVDCARVLALANGVPYTSTAERLRGAATAGALTRARATASVAAFFFIQRIRLLHQARLEALTPERANRIDPEDLNELDRRTLKAAFRIGRDLQQRLALDYQL